MLEDLDKVPWESLQHAYGLATDVPQLLRDITSDQADIREKAWFELYGNLWHQGTVYQATPHAVPLLIELLREPDVPERHEILVYLGALAGGSSYLDVHQHAQAFPKLGDEPDFEVRLRQELEWVRETRDAVRAGGPRYQGLLSDSEAPVRAAAAYLLGHFSEDAARNFSWLRAHMESGEPDEMARAACIFSAGLLAPHRTEAPAWLEYVLAGDASSAVRVAAALGLAWSMGEAIPEVARDLITDATKSPRDAEGVFNRFPWDSEDLRTYCSDALAVIGDRSGDSLSALIHAMDNVPPYESWEVARAMLHLVFAGKPMPHGTTADRLTEDQRTALLAIAGSTRFWTGFTRNTLIANSMEILQAFGLPDKPGELLAFLRVDGSEHDPDAR